MKKTTKPIILALALVAGFVACTRNNASKGSIIRVSPSVNTLLISSSQLDTADAFFKKNGISFSGLQPSVFLSGYASLLNANGQPYNGLYYLVACNQFANGLPVYGETLNLYFDSTGASLPYDNYGYTGPQPRTDTTPWQSLENLRRAFLTTIKKDSTIGIFAGSLYQDSALQATLGYLDASIIPNSGVTASNTTLWKIWVVGPVNPGKAGRILVVDSTGEVWQ